MTKAQMPLVGWGLTMLAGKQWQDLGDNLPGLGPANAMLIHEHPHQLGHPNGWVGVIQLEGHLVWEGIQGAVGLLEAAHYILQNHLLVVCTHMGSCS